MNCAGCKWLDQAVNGRNGDGYCGKVVESKDYIDEVEKRLITIEEIRLFSKKVRTAEKERCELYSEGSFSERFTV